MFKSNLFCLSYVFTRLLSQGQIAKQLKDYLSLDPFSQFPFPGPQAPFLRDFPKVNLTVPATTTSSRTPEVNRDSASPKTVSAAVTLSSMEKGRGEESRWTAMATPSAKNDQNSVVHVDRVQSPRLRPTAESAITKEIGMISKLCRFLFLFEIVNHCSRNMTWFYLMTYAVLRNLVRGGELPLRWNFVFLI